MDDRHPDINKAIKSLSRELEEIELDLQILEVEEEELWNVTDEYELLLERREICLREYNRLKAQVRQ